MTATAPPVRPDERGSSPGGRSRHPAPPSQGERIQGLEGSRGLLDGERRRLRQGRLPMTIRPRPSATSRSGAGCLSGGNAADCRATMCLPTMTAWSRWALVNPVAIGRNRQMEARRFATSCRFTRRGGGSQCPRPRTVMDLPWRSWLRRTLRWEHVPAYLMAVSGGRRP